MVEKKLAGGSCTALAISPGYLYGFTDRRAARGRKQRNKRGRKGRSKTRLAERRKEPVLFSGIYAGLRFITASPFFSPSVLCLRKIIKQLSALLVYRRHFISRTLSSFPVCRSGGKKLALSSFFDGFLPPSIQTCFLVYRSFPLPSTFISNSSA